MSSNNGNTPLDSDIRDITVIGAGPVGLITAFWAGMREASSRIVDSLPELMSSSIWRFEYEPSVGLVTP